MTLFLSNLTLSELISFRRSYLAAARATLLVADVVVVVAMTFSLSLRRSE